MENHEFITNEQRVCEDSSMDNVSPASSVNSLETRQRRQGYITEIPPKIEDILYHGNKSTTFGSPSESLSQLNIRELGDKVTQREDTESINSYQLQPSKCSDQICFGIDKIPAETRPNGLQDILDDTVSSTHEGLRKISSVGHISQSQPPTSDKEKQSWIYNSLFGSLGLIYAIMLVTIGLIIYVTDVMMDARFIYAESYNIYLIIVQLIFLVYIHIDARHYIYFISKELEKAEKENKMEENKSSNTDVIPLYYGFASGRHGGSLYLKIGTAVFCFGYMIQGGLELGQKILYVTDDKHPLNLCTNTVDLVVSTIRPLYVFYKLFFIFKFSNLIINRRIYISKIGIMHCGGSSLCFWLYSIVQETAHSLANDISDGSQGSNESVGSIYEVLEPHKWTLKYECDQDTQLTNVLNTLKPYLFPFSIEFNIMMIGFWILLWENLGRIDRHTHIPSIEVTFNDDEENGKSFMSNLVIYVDCHASLRGLFAGLLIIVATTISIILFFILSANEETEEMGMHVNIYSELILFILMFTSSAVSFYELQRLDIITHTISYSDDILLFLCLPLLFLYALTCTIPFYGNDRPAFILLNALQMIQAILQTTLIIDGLRRCSNSPSLRSKKPGRELIMFLVVTNLALWLLQTFQIISKNGNDYAYDYYGKTLWTLLSHFTLPFVLFYRFHSSVCLADMWMEAYNDQHH